VNTKTYVLIETAVGKTKDVLKVLHGVNRIRDVDAVTGKYDIVTVVEAENLNSVSELVAGSIHTIGGILRTTTSLLRECGVEASASATHG
jgi:DNA-binding Lrp family transcriptional regulator